MKKCHTCGTTKGLKACIIEECDDHVGYDLSGRHTSCVCENCCKDEFGCCYCEGNINECIKRMLEVGIKEFEQINVDHAKTVMRMYNILENWNKFDYHWNPKKTIMVLQNG